MLLQQKLHVTLTGIALATEIFRLILKLITANSSREMTPCTRQIRFDFYSIDGLNGTWCRAGETWVPVTGISPYPTD